MLRSPLAASESRSACCPGRPARRPPPTQGGSEDRPQGGRRPLRRHPQSRRSTTACTSISSRCPARRVVTTMVAYKVGSSDENLDQHRPVALPRTPDVQGHRQDQARRHRPHHLPQRRRQQRLHSTRTTRSSTSTSPPTAGRRPWRSRPTACATCASTTSTSSSRRRGPSCNELKRDEDEPWDLEHKAIVPLLFGKTAPYGHPVIGRSEHVRAATAEIIKAHYDKWYHPNNASLVVCGGFDPDKALAKIKKLFGPIPKAELPERKPLSQEKLTRPARLEMDSKFDVPRMLMGCNTVRQQERRLPGPERGRVAAQRRQDEPAVQEAGRGRAGGRGRRRRQQRRPLPRLVRDRGGVVRQDKDRDQAEKLVLAELKKLADEPITAAELKRVQRQLLAGVDLRPRERPRPGRQHRPGRHHQRPRLPQEAAAAHPGRHGRGRAARRRRPISIRKSAWSVLLRAQGRRQGAAAPHSRGPKASARRRSSAGAAGGRRLLAQGREARRAAQRPDAAAVREPPPADRHGRGASSRTVNVYEPDDKLGVATLTGMLLRRGHDEAHRAGDRRDDRGRRRLARPEFGRRHGQGADAGPAARPGPAVRVPDASQPSPRTRSSGSRRSAARRLHRRGRRSRSRGPQRRLPPAVYGKHPRGRPSLGTVKTVETLTPADCVAFHQKVFVPEQHDAGRSSATSTAKEVHRRGQAS